MCLGICLLKTTCPEFCTRNLGKIKPDILLYRKLLFDKSFLLGSINTKFWDERPTLVPKREYYEFWWLIKSRLFQVALPPKTALILGAEAIRAQKHRSYTKSSIHIQFRYLGKNEMSFFSKIAKQITPLTGKGMAKLLDVSNFVPLGQKGKRA